MRPTASSTKKKKPRLGARARSTFPHTRPPPPFTFLGFRARHRPRRRPRRRPPVRGVPVPDNSGVPPERGVHLGARVRRAAPRRRPPAGVAVDPPVAHHGDGRRPVGRPGRHGVRRRGRAGVGRGRRLLHARVHRPRRPGHRPGFPPGRPRPLLGRGRTARCGGGTWRAGGRCGRPCGATCRR